MDNNKTVIKKSYTIKKEMLKNVAEIKQVIKVARKTHKTLLWCRSRNTGANYLRLLKMNSIPPLALAPQHCESDWSASL